MLSATDINKLNQAFLEWPDLLAPYGHPDTEPAFTIGMETLGSVIRTNLSRGNYDPKELKDFLIKIGEWKMPRQKESHAVNVNKNTDQAIINTFQKLSQATDDLSRINICTGIAGFGKTTGQTRMASTILRFIWPEDYGVIDWRNWAVLSNCEYSFLSNPLLPKKSNGKNGLREAMYGASDFVQYVSVLRQLRPCLGLQNVADVDLALYGYSAKIWPFPKLEEILYEQSKLNKNLNSPAQIPLKAIYETYWDEWDKLIAFPLTDRIALKMAFLTKCLEVTPLGIKVLDDKTQQSVPYIDKHKRDLGDLERKISKSYAQDAEKEIESFVWNIRLKGMNLGVIKPRKSKRI